MEYSIYQKEIFKNIIFTDKNIVVDATAGSGKTTTILNAISMLPFSTKYKVIAFNNSIVDELKERRPDLDTQTLHSLGLRLLYTHFSKVKISGNRVFFLLYKNVFKEDGYKTQLATTLFNLTRLNTTDLSLDMFEYYNTYYSLLLPPQDLLQLEHWVQEYYLPSLHNSEIEVDFTDMVFLPNYLNIEPQYKYDIVFIDEAQDLSTMQQQLAFSIIKPNGRFVAVGDSYQCIYGFAGSNVRIFQQLKERENTITLPLPVSYRCGKNIVELAKNYCNKIQYFENNEDGNVHFDGDIKHINKGDMVLSRLNAPLVSVFFLLVERKIPCYIVGRDILQGIEEIYKSVKNNSTKGVLDKCDTLLQDEYNRLKDRGVKTPLKHPSLIRLKDKVDVIKIIASRSRTVGEIPILIRRLFEERRDGVKLMTIHKSKGLENGRVFIIRSIDNRVIFPFSFEGIKPWEEEQENNLQFVGVTRAKKEIFFLNL